MFCCPASTSTSVNDHIIHASYHNVNMIMGNKLIEIDKSKADKKILIMHKNI